LPYLSGCLEINNLQECFNINHFHSVHKASSSVLGLRIVRFQQINLIMLDWWTLEISLAGVCVCIHLRTGKDNVNETKISLRSVEKND
jgi:hypothetical protein